MASATTAPPAAPAAAEAAAEAVFALTESRRAPLLYIPPEKLQPLGEEPPAPKMEGLSLWDDLLDGEWSKSSKRLNSQHKRLEKFANQLAGKRDRSLIRNILPEGKCRDIRKHELPAQGSAALERLLNEGRAQLRDMEMKQGGIVKSHATWFQKGKALAAVPTDAATNAKRAAIESMVDENNAVDEVDRLSSNRKILEVVKGFTPQMLDDLGNEKVAKEGIKIKAEKQKNRAMKALQQTKAFSQAVTNSPIFTIIKDGKRLSFRSYEQQKDFANKQVTQITEMNEAYDQNLNEFSKLVEASDEDSKRIAEERNVAEADLLQALLVAIEKTKTYTEKWAQDEQQKEECVRLAETGKKLEADKALFDGLKIKALETCKQLADEADLFEKEGKENLRSTFNELTQHHRANFEDLSEHLSLAAGWAGNFQRHHEFQKKTSETRQKELEAKQAEALRAEDSNGAQAIGDVIESIKASISENNEELRKVADCQRKLQQSRQTLREFLEKTPDILSEFDRTFEEKKAETDNHFQKAIWTEKYPATQPSQAASSSSSSGFAVKGSAIVSMEGNQDAQQQLDEVAAKHAKLSTELAVEREQRQILRQAFLELKKEKEAQNQVVEKVLQELAELRAAQAAQLPTIAENQQLQSQAPTHSLLQQQDQAPAPAMPRAPSTESLSTVSSAWIDLGEEDTTRPSTSAVAAPSGSQ